MPHFADASGSWETFDVASASTQFWERVPVVTKAGDREEELRELTVRILSGFARQNHNLRILRVHVSSEEDLLFLHTLEVSEDEFQSLKIEQGILVDFSSFPGKIISLLGKCIESRGEDMPRFQAVLTISPGESRFQIVETNDFNKLPHVTLRFRPGDDLAIKQFLAFRLSEIKGSCSQLENELRDARREGEMRQCELSQTQVRLDEVERSHRQQMMEAEANAKSTRIALQEESSHEKSMLRDRMERERCELEQRLRDELAAVKARNEKLDAENRELLAGKLEISARVSDLEHRLAVADQERHSLREDCAALRDQNRQLSGEKHDLELRVNDAKVSTRGLEEQVARHKDSFVQRQAQIDSLDSAKAHLEARGEELKENLMKAEERAAEIMSEKKKADEIIASFARELRETKEKTRKKSAQLLRQEDVVLQLRSQVDEGTRERDQLQGECDRSQRDVSRLESANKDLKDRLEECQKQLEESSQMTRWLSSQVTDGQLKASASTGLSRGFHPTVQLPSSTSNLRAPQMRYAGQQAPPPAFSGGTSFASRYHALKE